MLDALGFLLQGFFARQLRYTQQSHPRSPVPRVWSSCARHASAFALSRRAAVMSKYRESLDIDAKVFGLAGYTGLRQLPACTAAHRALVRAGTTLMRRASCARTCTAFASPYASAARRSSSKSCWNPASPSTHPGRATSVRLTAVCARVEGQSGHAEVAWLRDGLRSS